LKLSRMNSRGRGKVSTSNMVEGVYLTQPTLLGNMQTMYEYDFKHSENDYGAKN